MNQASSEVAATDIRAAGASRITPPFIPRLACSNLLAAKASSATATGDVLADPLPPYRHTAMRPPTTCFVKGTAAILPSQCSALNERCTAVSHKLTGRLEHDH